MRTSVKITFEFDDDLLAHVKKLAADTDRTLPQVVEDSLLTAIARCGEKSDWKAIALHTCDGKGLQPGVNLNSNSAVEDTMNDPDAGYNLGRGSRRRAFSLAS